MKRRFFLLFTLFVPFAEAGVSLHIEHPRNPSHNKDLYQIECKAKCDLLIKSLDPAKGSSSSKIFKAKIDELFDLHAKGSLPQSKVDARPVLYKIEAKDGKKKVDLVLGYPLSYEGEEYKKYSKLISLIEEVKRNMTLELLEKK